MTPRRWATARLVAGIALTAVFWALSWLPHGPVLVRGWFFFFLWLGYILTVDSLVFFRRGSSPISRGAGGWLVLFLVSVPAWWLFEYLNRFLRNWEYVGTGAYGPLEHAFFSSLSFSTVVPAVLTTAELLASLSWPGPEARWLPLPMSARSLSGWIALGLVLLMGVVVWPHLFFPATWLAVFFVLDPLNHLAGRPAIAARVQAGSWRLVLWLGLAALVCGVFWEMWNWRASPKWIYHVPYVGFAKVFEMPLLGYLGYLPFGLEVYALYHFLVGIVWPPGRWPLAIDSLAPEVVLGDS